MGYNPINLMVRFLLEMTTLVAAGMWGWKIDDGWIRYLWALGIPILLAILWGIFAVPNDPSRSGSALVPIPGWMRLLLELLILTFGVWSLYETGHATSALIFVIVFIVHYGFSYDRILWLISGKNE